MEHWIWFSIFSLTIIWYIVVTILVAIRGSKNIKEMIKELKNVK